VKLDIGKLKFDLSVSDFEKDSLFEKPLNLVITFLMIFD